MGFSSRIVGLIWPSPLVKCLRKHLGWLNLLLIRSSGRGCISRGDTPRPFRCFFAHVDVSFLPFVADCLFHLLFYHGAQGFRINDFLALNTPINMFLNKNQASRVNDLGTDHHFIVRRFKVVDEPFNHLLFHHGRKHLCGYLTPPLGILTKKFPTFPFCPLKNCVIGSYLSVELVILQDCIGHLSLAGGLFQSYILCGCRASKVIRENLTKRRMIVSIGFHIPTKYVLMGTGISSAIVHDKLECLELGRHNGLRQMGQTV